MARIILKDKDMKELIGDPVNYGDWDQAIMVTGREGSGKSTLTQILAYLLEGKDWEWIIRNCIIYSPTEDEMEEKIKTKDVKVIVNDEAIKKLFSKEHYSKIANYLTKLFTVCRQHNKISFFNIPRRNLLLKFFREGRCFYWLHVAFTGIAILFMFDDNAFTDDGWNIKYNMKLFRDLTLGKKRQKQLKDVSIENELEAYSKSLNYVGEFHFDKVPEEWEKLYKVLKHEAELKDLNTEDDDFLNDRTYQYYLAIKRLFYYFKSNKLVSQKKLSDVVGWTPQRISDFIKKFEKELREDKEKVLITE